MFLAWREIRRAKARFLLLAGAVGLLMYVLLVFQAVSDGLVSGLTGAIEKSSAEVLVFAEEARRNPSASTLSTEVADQVAEVDGVAEVAALGQSFFSVEAGGEGLEAVLFGIDPEGPGAPTTVVDGRLPEAVGEVVASVQDESGFGIGDTVKLEPHGQELTVVGIAEAAQLNVLPTLYGTFDTYTEAVRGRAPVLQDVPASILAVSLVDGAEPVDVAERITAEVDRVEALDRETAVESLPGSEQVTQSFSILNGLLFAVVTIVTGVFFLILTVQKRDALVLLRAVGASPGDLVKPVVLQVGVVVGGGLIAGTALAAVTLVGLSSILEVSLAARTVLTTAVAVLVLGLIAASGAIRRILRIEPIEITGVEVA